MCTPTVFCLHTLQYNLFSGDGITSRHLCSARNIEVAFDRFPEALNSPPAGIELQMVMLAHYQPAPDFIYRIFDAPANVSWLNGF